MGPSRWSGEQQRTVRNIGRASQVGIFLAVATFIGWAIGQWLDRLFGTDPWLTVVCAMLGVAAGFIELFHVVSSITADEEQAEKDKKTEG